MSGIILASADKKQGEEEQHLHISKLFRSVLAVNKYCLRRYSCALSAWAPTDRCARLQKWLSRRRLIAEGV
jgi:hypothetical protein